MEFEDTKKFLFVSKALPEDTFAVVRFDGTEGISKLYSFDITLVSDDPEIDLKEILQNPATLTILGDHLDLPVHGVLARFEQLHEVKHHFFYRAVLVPRLWLSSLYHENQLFLDRTVPDIIEDILKQTGLTTQDYELRLTKEYPQWEYICQYRETDYEFISRWMEREGIYFFFEQTDDYEKLVITDSFTAHQDIKGDALIPYAPPTGLVPEEELIQAFISRQTMLPNKVILKDYNYRKPSLELKAEAIVDPQGRGDVYLYGEHFKEPEQGSALAKIRAEEIACRANVFHGEGTATNLSSGYLFELADHYREGFNRKYLILDIEHEAVQAASFLSGLGEDLTEKEQKRTYTNRFTTIPAGVQFRPERTTQKPKIQGTMNAVVDAAGDGKYAELDDQGRYKVILPFDLSGNNDGRASRWVRMAQPYAGAEYGMHFPLHKGTEVLLTFIDGDPDRPIIASAVPNPATASPVNTENQSESVIKTGGDNKIRIEDREDSERIIMQSPKVNSFIRIGTPNDPTPVPKNPAITLTNNTISIIQDKELPDGWSKYEVNPGFEKDNAVYDGASATAADSSTTKIKVPTPSSSEVDRTTPGNYQIKFTVSLFKASKDPVRETLPLPRAKKDRLPEKWTWKTVDSQDYTISVQVKEKQEKEYVEDKKKGDGIKIQTDGGIEIYTGKPEASLKNPQDINIITHATGKANEGNINIEANNIGLASRDRSVFAIEGDQISFLGGNSFEFGAGNSVSLTAGTENSFFAGGKFELGAGSKSDVFVGSSFGVAFGAKYDLFKGDEYEFGNEAWKKHSNKSITIDAEKKIELIGGKLNNSKITGEEKELTLQFGQDGESVADRPYKQLAKHLTINLVVHVLSIIGGASASSLNFALLDPLFESAGLDELKGAARGSEAAGAGLAVIVMTGLILLLKKKIVGLDIKKKRKKEILSEITMNKDGIIIGSKQAEIDIQKGKHITVAANKDLNLIAQNNVNLVSKKSKKVVTKSNFQFLKELKGKNIWVMK
jgi:type VI secretion system VgrG family protein